MSNKSLITLPILAAFVILMTSPDWMMAGLLEQQQLEPTRIQQTRLPKPDIPAVDFGNHYALVIGNSAYPRFTDLATPANDARAMAKLLTDKYRFKTEILINANRLTFLKAISAFRERLTEEDNFLLYYAGHGMLSKGTDRCHWLPVDADPDRQENWISNVTIVQQISRMTAKHIMVIADSCFDTRAIHTNLARSGSKTLSAEHYQQLAKIRSRTILASGGMHPVLGGDDDNHSIFSNSLLKTLEYSNEIIDGMELYRAVYEKVRAPGNIGNGQTQAPAFDIIPNTGDLGAPFFFVPD